MGCADMEEDDAASAEGELGASAGVEFTSAVGAVVVNGKKVCTAALVDVDADARIGSVSARGRQILMGGACVGKLANGFTGAAVFVTQQNGVSVSTPIVAFDFESQAEAGLAVGILGKKVPGAQPIDVIGTSALVNAGARVASVIEANEDGILIGAAVEIHAGVEFSLKTQCTSFQFGVQAGVAVGAGVALRDDGLGAAAFVKVQGKLYLAAHIDGGCVVRKVGRGFKKLGNGVLTAANEIGNAFSSIGTGEIIAVVHTKERFTTFAVKMTEHVEEIRINGQGRISAKDSRGAACDKIPLVIFGGPCKLESRGGYRKGELVTITVDTHANVFPDGDRGQQLTISTK
ncbi:MAG: hypothetical protein KIT84_33615 [Labilithrix sp.]|nr:hypothetical protein [Labilithrix sp.]MCW5815986.1 hypothetical protein [Labilithrix sp.]